MKLLTVLFGPILYFILPKHIIAKGYIKTLINQNGHSWKKVPIGLLEDLADDAIKWTALMLEMRKGYFADELENQCKLRAYFLCDRLENKINPDVTDDIKAIFDKYD